MCGFVAILQAAGQPDAGLLRRMGDAIAHRGPDDRGQYIAQGVGFEHRRLSIIDLAGGHQPMVQDGVVLAFNGEIYNYIELRNELITRGHRFHTTSDTEVLLRLYLEYGEACVERLNGMFAFVLHDTRRRGCLVARDHFGIKPLYYWRGRDRLIFASEIKALLHHPGVERRLDAIALDDYLALQYVLEDRTLFEGIHRVQPAQRLWVDLTTLKARPVRYWQRSFQATDPDALPPSTEELRQLVHASVRRQMRSDVPVGAYLSGGLDSSLVAAAASHLTDLPQVAFTGAFREGPAFDESGHARTVADHIGARLDLLYPTEQQWIDLLPRIVYQMDEPAAGPGLFPQYMVSGLARQSVKVCLGGQGGDELFGGYARHLIGALEEALQNAITGQTPAPGTLTLADLELGLGTLAPYQPLLRAAWQSGLGGPAWRRYFRLVDRGVNQSPWLTDDLRSPARKAGVADRFARVFDEPQGCSPVQRMLEFDLRTSLPALLQVEDRVSMAVSLESRVPLLDPELAQAAALLPDRLLLKGGRLKAVLRDVARPWLPNSIIERGDKMGFPVPLQHWARGRAGEFVRDILLSQRCRERGLFQPAAIESLIESEREFGRTLWGALQLELWHRVMIDESPCEGPYGPEAERIVAASSPAETAARETPAADVAEAKP